MKKILLLGFCIVALSSAAYAQSAEYYEGYNAGTENQLPPDVSSSADYLAGWKAGHAEEEAKAAVESTPAEPQEPSDAGAPAQDSGQ